MTPETSKARGVHTCSYACERPECIRAQRDELASRVTAPPPAAARGDVRGLDLPLIACMLGDLGSNDASTYPAEVVAEQIRAIEALAAEGVQAGEVEQRAPDVAMALHWIDRYADGIDDDCQIDLVAEALGVTLPDGYGLSQQPEARGVVDESAVERACADLIAALTGERNG